MNSEIKKNSQPKRTPRYRVVRSETNEVSPKLKAAVAVFKAPRSGKVTFYAVGC